jgi:hypothetical protein
MYSSAFALNPARSLIHCVDAALFSGSRPSGLLNKNTIADT